MTYRAPPQGRGDRRLNTTNYEHPQETNLLDLHRTMEYNQLGQPVIRTTSGASVTANDAFGRLRVSNQFTLHDNFHRYYIDYHKSSNNIVGGGSVTFDANAALVNMTVGTASGDSVTRETNRVFSYQPAKSLQVMRSFVFAPAQANLTQRVGYYDSENGIFLELADSTLSWVIRSKSSGTILEDRVTQENWNVDPLNGTGTSTMVIDISKAQIMWADVEWLGVGSIRTGFIIDGEFVHCHTFHHANLINNTYMTTACLPVRIEITNTGPTQSNSTLKQICTSVVSEGGFELIGRPHSIGHELNTPYRLATPNVLYPIMSLRLRTDRLNAIIIPKNFSLAVTAASTYQYFLVVGGVTVGGTWKDYGPNSSVQYNLTGTSIGFNGQQFQGNVETGYIAASNQTTVTPSLAEVPFFYQLERNPFTANATEFTVCVKSTGNNLDIFASVNWEEIT
jgi:hypothetical protein